MNVNEAIDYINSAVWSQWRLGLDRTYELLERVGRPDRQPKFVHVAGTNGKGSTCAMIESMLRAAGYTTGTYPSPYIEDFRERIQVNAEPIPERDLCELTEMVKAEADKMEDHPSQFEIITAIGMLWFAKNNCDIVVLEVGLGGAFDSTNVIDAPEVAVITNIGLDHTEYLGETLAEIAETKCGIIKSGSDVVAYPNVKEVADVIEAVCKEKECRLDYADFARIEPLESDITGQSFLWKSAEPVWADESVEEFNDPKIVEAKADIEMFESLAADGHSDAFEDDLRSHTNNQQMNVGDAERAAETIKTSNSKMGLKEEDLLIRTPLIGEYQLRNAATALTVIEALRRRGWDINDEAVIKGMAEVSWPARFEVLGTDPVFILDGGHNKQCAEAVAESLAKYFPDGELTLIIGVLSDKDYEAILDVLLPHASKCLCLTPDSDRALPAEQLADIIRTKGKEAEPCETAGEAVKKAIAGDTPVLAFGSLYLAGAVRKAYRKINSN